MKSFLRRVHAKPSTQTAAIPSGWLLCACALLACNLGQFLPATPTRVAPMPTLAATPTVSPTPTRRAQLAPPAWWDLPLALPASAEFEGDAKRAVWRTRDLNVDTFRDSLLQQAKSAGYQTYVLTQSQGAIYDLLFVKGQTAYALNLTLGSDAVILTGTRVGVMRVKISGVANVEIDLPMRTRLDVTPGSEVSIGAAIPSPQCAACEYFVNVHIAPFKGVGNYDSKPGTYLIDAQVIPGGEPAREDFRWAYGGCTVTVKETSGTFECKQLQNVIDQSRRIDVSGSWIQP